MRKNAIILMWTFIWVVGFMYLTMAFPSGLENSVSASYIVLLLSLAYVGILMFLVYHRYGIDVIEPVTIYAFLHILLFNIYPLVLIISDRYTFHGIDVIGGCIKGTLIANGSFTFFLLGYYSKRKKAILRFEKVEFFFKTEKDALGKKLGIAYIIWGFCFLASIVYLLQTGKSLIYIFTLGQSGEISTTNDNVAMKFLTNFGYAMVTGCLYIFYYEKRKPLKYGVIVLTMLMYLLRGFRFIMVALALALAAMHCIREKRRPKLRWIILSVVVAVLLLSVIGEMRNGVRSGSTSDFSISESTSLESIDYMLYSNLNIVQPYYAMVEKIPSQYPHTYGMSMIVEPLIMFVPRALWQGKPTSDSAAVISSMTKCMGANVGEKYGLAVPYLAEIYCDFGIIGCCILMLLLGMFLNHLKALLYVKKPSADDIVLYSVIYGILFQFIIRGYMPSNFWILTFMLIPVFIMRRVR